MNEKEFVAIALRMLKHEVKDEDFNLNICGSEASCGCVMHHLAKAGRITLHTDGWWGWPDARKWLRDNEIKPDLRAILGFDLFSEAEIYGTTLDKVTRQQVIEQLEIYNARL